MALPKTGGQAAPPVFDRAISGGLAPARATHGPGGARGREASLCQRPGSQAARVSGARLARPQFGEPERHGREHEARAEQGDGHPAGKGIQRSGGG